MNELSKFTKWIPRAIIWELIRDINEDEYDNPMMSGSE